MPLDKQLDHNLLNFSILLAYPHPLFCIFWPRTTAFIHPVTTAEHFLVPPRSSPLHTFNEDDLVFAGVKFIANDYLVAVAFQRGFGFRNKERVIGLELHRPDRWYHFATYRYRIEVKERGSDMATATQRQSCTHLERDDVALWRPFVNQWFEDLRYLIHLNEQATLSALNFVLGLKPPR